MSVTSWCSKCFCVALCVYLCTGNFVMVPLNLRCLHYLHHSFFEHLLNLYIQKWFLLHTSINSDKVIFSFQLFVSAGWWDPSLDTACSPQYTYTSETDTWRRGELRIPYIPCATGTFKLCLRSEYKRHCWCWGLSHFYSVVILILL